MRILQNWYFVKLCYASTLPSLTAPTDENFLVNNNEMVDGYSEVWNIKLSRTSGTTVKTIFDKKSLNLKKKSLKASGILFEQTMSRQLIENLIDWSLFACICTHRATWQWLEDDWQNRLLKYCFQCINMKFDIEARRWFNFSLTVLNLFRSANGSSLN